MRSRGAAAIALASPTSFWPVAVVACAGVLLWRTRDWGLLGMDAFRIIENVRVQSPGDLARPFIERLAGGYNFYRPFFNLSVAVDYALWGLRGWGYHLTTILFFAACATSTGLLAGRLVGAQARLAAPVAVLVVLLSPIYAVVLPVLARRPEVMVATFVPLAVWTQISPRALSRRRPPLLPALLALLAMGSKDNGVVAVPLCLLAVYLCSPRPDLRGRARHVLWAALPHAFLLALFLPARTAVLDGLGGFHDADPLAALASFPARFPRMLDTTIRPAPAGVVSAIDGWLAAACAVLFAAAAGAGRLAGPRGAEEGPRTHAGRAAAIGVAWMALMIAIYALRRTWPGWYAFPLLGGWALLLGAGAERLLYLARSAPRARAPAVLALALLAVMVAWNARFSPVLRRYDELGERTVIEADFYAELRAHIDAAPVRSVVAASVPPIARTVGDGEPFSLAPQGITRASIRAWAALVVPERKVRVKLAPKDGRVRAGPHDDVVVALAGAWGELP